LGNAPPEACILSQTDKSSAAGWLCRSNFSEGIDSAIQLTMASQLATLVIDAHCCLLSQRFPGEENVVSDCLSHDFHLNYIALTHLVHFHAKHQVPFGFNLYPLPTKISSRLTCLLWNQLSDKQWSKEQTRSNFLRGMASDNIFYQLGSNLTGSLMDSPATKNTEYLEHLQQLSEKVDSVIRECLSQNLAPFGPPWIAWLRPSSWLIGLTQDLTKTPTLHSFYNHSFDPTKDQTVTKK
jgi:hypothetical protein